MFDRLFRSNTPLRLIGQPTSSNRASSFHAFWQMPLSPSVPLVEVSATIEVLTPPAVPMLHFWALQASFVKQGRRVGAGHFGIQYHSKYPDFGAVNWGGYTSGGGQIEGSPLAFPSALDNANTCNYAWQPGSAYKYRIYRSSDSDGGWLGSINDLTSGVETIIRTLKVDADSLERPMVWTESFAHCDHPSVAVRWSGLAGRGAGGEMVLPEAVKLNYQSHDAGGCGNTDTSLDVGSGDRAALVQRTNTERTNAAGSRLPMPNTEF